MKRWLLRGGLVLLAVFLLIQAVPYGWRHSNPPVTSDAPWPSARSAELARAACYDCHSNETEWPVYSYVAPMSWLVRSDVEAGRDELNFSEWDRDPDADDAADAVAEGSMPPSRYTRLHSDADLSDVERAELVAALEAMEEPEGGDDNGDDNSGPGGGDDEDDNDNSGPGGGGNDGD